MFELETELYFIFASIRIVFRFIWLDGRRLDSRVQKAWPCVPPEKKIKVRPDTQLYLELCVYFGKPMCVCIYIR